MERADTVMDRYGVEVCQPLAADITDTVFVCICVVARTAVLPHGIDSDVFAKLLTFGHNQVIGLISPTVKEIALRPGLKDRELGDQMILTRGKKLAEEATGSVFKSDHVLQSDNDQLRNDLCFAPVAEQASALTLAGR